MNNTSGARTFQNSNDTASLCRGKIGERAARKRCFCVNTTQNELLAHWDDNRGHHWYGVRVANGFARQHVASKVRRVCLVLTLQNKALTFTDVSMERALLWWQVQIPEAQQENVRAFLSKSLDLIVVDTWSPNTFAGAIDFYARDAPCFTIRHVGADLGEERAQVGTLRHSQL